MYFGKVMLTVEEPWAEEVETIPDVKRIFIWRDGDDPNVSFMGIEGNENTTVYIRIREDGRCRVMIRPEGEIPRRVYLDQEFDEVEIEQDDGSFSLYCEASEWWDSRRDGYLPFQRSH